MRLAPECSWIMATLSKTDSCSIACSVWNVRLSSPAGSLDSRPSGAGSRRRRAIDPVAGLTKPLRTLKKVVLPAPFGPIRPQVPPGNTTLIPSIGVTPAKRTVKLLDLDHVDSLPRRSACGDSRQTRRPRFAMSFGICWTMPAGRCQQHLQQTDTEDDEEEVRVDPPLRLEEERHELDEARRRRRRPRD